MCNALAKLALSLSVITLTVSAFADDPSNDAIARSCLPILQGYTAQQLPPTGMKATLDQCAAIQACQNAALQDVPQCALKLNTWVFSLNIPQPPGGNSHLSALPPGGPTQPASMESPSPQKKAQMPQLDKPPKQQQSPGKDGNTHGINWF